MTTHFSWSHLTKLKQNTEKHQIVLKPKKLQRNEKAPLTQFWEPEINGNSSERKVGRKQSEEQKENNYYYCPRFKHQQETATNS